MVNNNIAVNGNKNNKKCPLNGLNECTQDCAWFIDAYNETDIQRTDCAVNVVARELCYSLPCLHYV